MNNKTKKLPVNGISEQEQPVKKIMIVDDHDLVRESLVRSLNFEDDFEVVFHSGDCWEAIKYLESEDCKPVEIILMDLRFKNEVENDEEEGFKASRYILENLYVKLVQEYKIIILSNFLNGFHIKKAYDMGIRGYVPKEYDSEKLFEAIREVYNSDTKMYYPGEVREKMDSFIAGGIGISESFEMPAKMEKEVLYLLAEGYKIAEIAKIREVTFHTIDAQCRSLKDKLNAKNIPHLISIAYKRGILKIY